MELEQIEREIEECFIQIQKTKSDKRKNDLFKRINKLKKLKNIKKS